MRMFLLFLVVPFFFLKPALAAKVVFYLNFEGNSYHHNHGEYGKNSFKVETLKIGGKEVSINKDFSPSETKKQFFLNVIEVPSGVYDKIGLNGKVYILSSPLSLKENSVKAVFFKLHEGQIQVFPQKLLSVSKKQFFSVPSINALGVIDEDSGFVSGFIGLQSAPYGVAAFGDKVYTGLENGQLVELDRESGFVSNIISLTSVSLENKLLHSDRKIYVPEKNNNIVYYFCPETGARFTVSLTGKVKDGYYMEKTGYLSVLTKTPDTVYLLSGGSGKIISSVSIPGDAVSVTGDENAVYVADRKGKTIYRYNLTSKSLEGFPLYEEPLIIRNFGDFLFLASKGNLLVLNKMGLTPYVIFNIKNVREMSFSQDKRKVFVFTEDKNYFVINLDSLYVEFSGDTPDQIFQAD